MELETAQDFDEAHQICADIRESDILSPIEKLCAWPFSKDDDVIHRSELCTITVGDLRQLLARVDQA